MLRVVVALLVASVLISCSADKKKESAVEEKVAAGTSEQSEPTQMIPDEELSEFDKLLDAHIKPYFDAGATMTEKAVAPGDSFDIFVFGEYSENYPMSAAEFMLSVPAAVEVLYETKSDSTVLTVGSYKKDYMMTFQCAKGPKFMMMKYRCRALAAFTGGVVETRQGMVHHFLGFTLCDETRTMVKAGPGRAALSMK